MAKKSQLSQPKSFEDALGELDQILRQIEGGSLDLEASLSQYERGMFLVKHCRGVLGWAEKQIELISGSAEQGVRVSGTEERRPDVAGERGSEETEVAEIELGSGETGDESEDDEEAAARR